MTPCTYMTSLLPCTKNLSTALQNALLVHSDFINCLQNNKVFSHIVLQHRRSQQTRPHECGTCCTAELMSPDLRFIGETFYNLPTVLVNISFIFAAGTARQLCRTCQHCKNSPYSVLQIRGNCWYHLVHEYLLTRSFRAFFSKSQRCRPSRLRSHNSFRYCAAPTRTQIYPSRSLSHLRLINCT